MIDQPLGISLLQQLSDGAEAALEIRELAAIRGHRFLVEGHAQRLDPVGLEPGVVRVAHDGEQPGASALAVKAVEEFERAQARLLDHVLGVARVARQPMRVVVGRVQMCREDLFKPLGSAALVCVQGLPLTCGPMLLSSGLRSRHAYAVNCTHEGHARYTGLQEILFPGISFLTARYIAIGKQALLSPSFRQETEMAHEINRRDFFQLTSLGGVGVVFASALPRAALGADQDEFYFLQLSDTHWGFERPPNPGAKGTLKKAVASVNALD